MRLHPIPGFPGYFATRNGKIYSKQRKERVRLYGSKNNKGYLRVVLYRDRERYQTQISRLIALTFIPNPNNLPIVLHIDNVPLNNKAKNLRWGTQSENIQQCYDEGRGVGNTQYTEDDINRMLGLWDRGDYNMKEIANKLDIPYRTVTKTINKFRCQPLIK